MKLYKPERPTLFILVAMLAALGFASKLLGPPRKTMPTNLVDRGSVGTAGHVDQTSSANNLTPGVNKSQINVQSQQSHVWTPCHDDHPGLCDKSSPKLGYYDMKFPINALDEAAVTLLKSSSRRTFFHFGSGSHHAVGLANMELDEDKRNFIISSTASYGEAEDFLKLVTPEFPLNRYYQVFYGNAFVISNQLLPPLDYALQFHLAEYGKTEEEEKDLISSLSAALVVGGKLVFNKKSRAYQVKGQALLKRFTTSESSPIPLIPTQALHPDLLFFTVPDRRCEDSVVPAAFKHPEWGYIYQKYCQEYNGCTSWYLPEQNLDITGVGSAESASKLVIVAHPDDELIFGGDDIGGGNQSDTFIVFGTRDFQRDEMAKEVVRELGFAGGIMFAHGDTNILETRADYRMYIDLKKVIESKKWDLIITHGESGEYGHPFHKIVHRMVMNIVHEISLDSVDFVPRELKVFDLNGGIVDQTILNYRIKLLEDVYKRPSSFWKQIFTAGTRAHPFPSSFFELYNDTLCWP